MNQYINNNHQIESDNNICKTDSIQIISKNNSLVSPPDAQYEQQPSTNNLPIEIIKSNNNNLLNSNNIVLTSDNIVIDSFGNSNNNNNVEVVTNKQILTNGTSGLSTDHNRNQNDSTKSLSNNPKKYGKFRILHNNNYTLTNNENNDHHLNDNNNNNSNGINDNIENFTCLNGGTASSAQTKIQMNGSLETDIVNANDGIDVLATNQKIPSSTSSSSNVNLENEKESVTTTPKRGRGKPKKPTIATKKTKSDLPTNNSATPRRSNRLLKLENNNKNEIEENGDDSSQRQLVKNSNSDISNDKNNNKHNESDTINGKESQQKSKSNNNDKDKLKIRKSKEKKKDKNKKIKDKNNKKHKVKLSKSLSSKNKKSDKSNSDKDQSDNHGRSSTKENFTLPQEPLSSTKESTTNNDMLITDESSKNTEKVKSKWRRDSELDNTTTVSSSPPTTNSSSITCSSPNKLAEKNENSIKNHNQVLQDCTNNISNNNNNNEPLPSYITIDDNIFLFEKKKSKTKKETKKMVCDCILTKEERAKGLMGCGDDCLNRMLMIECGSRCPLGEHCSNKRFQNKQYLKVEPFKTEKKGWGLMAMEPIPADTFIMEYVGEVIDPFMFHKRVEKYSKSKFRHHYFMALKSDEIIDATNKGNVTRFINHSCEPNAMTQKWTVNGELRIGFFSMKPIQAGEEITFDYQFQRYGKKAQKCFCETKSCRGFIGSSENANILTDGSKIPKKPSKDDDEGEEEDDDSDDDNMEEEEFLEDIALEEEIDLLAENGGLRNRQQILVVSRLMLRADKCELRIQLIEIIMSTIELAYLRLFLDYHGLQIIWGWMVEAEDVDLKARLLELLEILPIPNKTMLVDSKVYQVVERWAAPDSLESQQFLHINDDVNHSCNKDGKDDKDKNTKIDNKEEKDDKLLDTEVEDSETTIANNNSAEKKTTTEHLAKLSGKIVIKTKSKTLSTTNENGSSNGTTSSIGATNKSNVTIGFLAQKLLTHWKDLKEVFRIPRLEREQRRDDEAEADRRAKEEEERRSKGLPPMFHDDENKALFTNKDYAIAGILGKNRNRKLMRNAEKRGGMFRKRSSTSFSTNNNNINDNHNFLITNNSNSSQQNPTIKISKEEHRKRFELNVVHSDYSEMLKKYQEQLSLYNSHIAQQYFLTTTLPHNQNNSVDNSAVAAAAIPSAPIGGLNEFYRQYLNELANSNTTNSSNLLTSSPYLTTSINNNHPFMLDPRLSSSNLHQVSSYSTDLKDNNNDIQSTSLSMSKQHSNLNNNFDETRNYYMDTDVDVDFKDLIPPYQSPLVVLFEDSNFQSQNNNNSSTISPQAIDNVDFSQIKFESDNCIESMEKKMFDELYPPAGIFYVTQKGATYFVSLPSDPTQSIIVKENLTEPLPLSFTKRKPDDRLLLDNDWKYSMIDGHYFYHNKQKQVKQWHPPTDTQLDNYINTDDQPMDSLLCDISHDASTSSTPSIIYGNGISSSSHHKRKTDSYRKKKLIEEKFRNKISQFVVKCLNPYMKSSCQTARITNSEDFKNLARKLTHTIVGKEIKQCKKIEDLSYTESIKYKTKEYVKRYMSRFGSVYNMRESSREKSQSPII